VAYSQYAGHNEATASNPPNTRILSEAYRRRLTLHLLLRVKNNEKK